MKLCLSLIATLCLFTSSILSAQDSCNKWSFGADYRHLIPLEKLNADRYSNNNGVTFDAFYHGDKKCKVAFAPGIRMSVGISDAEDDSYNALGDIALVGRLMLRPHSYFNPYIEGYAGTRITTAQERITDTNSFEDTDQRFSRASSLIGLGLGALIKINETIDLNLKGNYNYSPRMDHYNPDNFGNSQRIITTNASDISLSIGLHFRIGCKSYDDYDENHYKRERTKVYKPRKRNVKKSETLQGTHKNEELK